MSLSISRFRKRKKEENDVYFTILNTEVATDQPNCKARVDFKLSKKPTTKLSKILLRDDSKTKKDIVVVDSNSQSNGFNRNLNTTLKELFK